MVKQALLSAFFVTLLFGCKEPGSQMENMKRMEDSIYKHYPTVNRVSVEVNDDYAVNITLGDKELYAAAEEKRKQVANELGQMTLTVFGNQEWLEKGKVVFVKEETTLNVTDSMVYDMDIATLKKSAK